MPAGYVIYLRSRADLKDVNQHVPGFIERTRPGVSVDPDAEIFAFGVSLLCRGDQLSHVLPMRAHEMRGAIDRVGSGMAECGLQESHQPRRERLPGHGKMAVL